jgi:hypothetical protein
MKIICFSDVKTPVRQFYWFMFHNFRWLNMFNRKRRLLLFFLLRFLLSIAAFLPIKFLSSLENGIE